MRATVENKTASVLFRTNHLKHTNSSKQYEKSPERYNKIQLKVLI